MKFNLIKITIILSLGLSFTSCQQIDNFFGKEGKKCNSQDIITLTEDILNSQILKDGTLKIDQKNIVVWDYNKVGRYNCKAKVSGINHDDALNRYMLIPYGLSLNSKTNEISGWIDYNTYKTTEGGGYYVQIETKKN